VSVRINAVTSANDAAIEGFARMRDRDLARGIDGQGLFVAEGEVVVRVLATRGRFPVRALLLEQRRVEPLADVIAALEARPEEIVVHVAAQPVMDAIVGFHIHRGVLALGARGEPLNPFDVLDGPGLAVGLVGLANHDNVGSIFRSAAAFGARVILDAATCDPLYRKAVRVSVGAALVVPFATVPDARAMIDLFEARGFEVLGLSPRGDIELDALPPASRRALLLGTEGPGLAADVLARTRPVRIPMVPGLDSLNVAVASGIALYEAARRRA
jgi:tRNA G18 (ribose-2'-O)-methylase SpoU